MNKIAIFQSSKESFKRLLYNIMYGFKFKKLNIDESFSDCLINRNAGYEEKEIFHIIRKSKNKEAFSKNITEYLQTKVWCYYANTLLIGNVTGKYVFSSFNYIPINQLNIAAFSTENSDILKDLKSHFFVYVINNNQYKNIFAEKNKIGDIRVKELSLDIKRSRVIEEFERTINGDETVEPEKAKIIIDYLKLMIGTYSKDDIKNNFNFILYDINNSNKKRDCLEVRRRRYLLSGGLSNNQLRKINEIDILERRLKSIGGKEAEGLLFRINKIKNEPNENISEIEDIYRDYEILFRQELIDKLYVPREDVTIIENYKDMRPQLIHMFYRISEKFRDIEIEKNKDRIIAERIYANDSNELTSEEQNRLNKLSNQIDANLDQYKVNYTTDGKGTIYTDAYGMDFYCSDTTNQISASIYDGSEFLNDCDIGINGIGFNKETLTAEAIAISSKNYKTTNRGLNNLEYNVENEFEGLSAPFSELIHSRGESEVVMQRRGMDFDTKASYIFAIIDSSNEEQTRRIMQEIEQIKQKEGLKVLIYDVYKIRKSMEINRQQQELDERYN